VFSFSWHTTLLLVGGRRLGDAACLVCVAVAVDWQAQRSCLSGVAVCIKCSNCKTVNTL